MRETGLMRRLIEVAIGRPAVADEGAVEVGAEHRRGFVKSAPVLNGVHDGARGRKDPQPPEPSPDFPAGLIRTDDRAPPDLVAQGRIGRRRLARGPMERVRHATRPDPQPKPVAPERGDLAVREAEVFIEEHDERDRLRPQMRTRRPEGVGSLERMAALHPASTVAAAADMHIEPAHVRPDDRQVFLDLIAP